MGAMKSKEVDTPNSSLPELSENFSPSLPQEVKQIKPISFESQQVSHAIENEVKLLPEEKEEIKPELYLPQVKKVPEIIEIIDSEESNLEIQFKQEPKVSKKNSITLANYEKHLKDLWRKDPTLSNDSFFKIAKTLFRLVQDERKMLLNLNKVWCDRLLEKMRS